MTPNTNAFKFVIRRAEKKFNIDFFIYMKQRERYIEKDNFI